MSVVEKIFGTHSQRELKRIEGLVDKIESLRPSMMQLTDAQLRDKTKEYKDMKTNEIALALNCSASNVSHLKKIYGLSTRNYKKRGE